MPTGVGAATETRRSSRFTRPAGADPGLCTPGRATSAVCALGGRSFSRSQEGSPDAVIARIEVDSRSVLAAELLEKVRAVDAASFERLVLMRTSDRAIGSTARRDVRPAAPRPTTWRRTAATGSRRRGGERVGDQVEDQPHHAARGQRQGHQPGPRGPVRVLDDPRALPALEQHPVERDRRDDQPRGDHRAGQDCEVDVPLSAGEVREPGAERQGQRNPVRICTPVWVTRSSCRSSCKLRVSLLWLISSGWLSCGLVRMVDLVLEGHLCSSAGRLSSRPPAAAGSPPPLEVDPLEVPAVTVGHAVDPPGRVQV